MRPKTAFVFNAQIIPFAPSNESVLEALTEAGIEIDHSCGGMGTCGTCRVMLNPESSQPKPSEGEELLRTERPLDPNERLACQLACSTQLILSSKKNRNR